MHSNCLTGERDLCDLLQSTHQPIFSVALKKFQHVSVVAAHGSDLDISKMLQCCPSVGVEVIPFTGVSETESDTNQ